MFITTDVRSGSAQMHVYGIDNACKLSYQGTVDLADKKVNVALPTDKPLYLAFEFYGGSYFTGRTSASYDMYLTLRAGDHYEAAVNYIDDMYGATIHEQSAHGGGRHQLARNVPACASKDK